MPTYEYQCNDCGHDFEIVQKFSDASLTECPQCQGNLHKVFSPVGVVFKGSGFYATDSRSKNTSTSLPASKPSESSSPSASSESAPAASGSTSSASSSGTSGGESAA